MHAVELHSRLDFGYKKDGYPLYAGAIQVFNSDPTFALDIVQAIVELCKITTSREWNEMSIMVQSIGELNNILINGGSKWHVVIEGEKARLEARVNETTEKSYKALIENKADYATLLKTSWEHCYGRSPNTSATYSNAIKAVEAATWQTITPKNDLSTLGTLIKDLDMQAKAGKFEVAFHDKNENDTVETILSMMRRLWESQTDRHATGNYVIPTQVEAEVAVHLAIVICHMFSKGIVTRKS